MHAFGIHQVFIDYGANWEKSWANHVKNWKPPTNSTYSPIVDVIKNNELTMNTIKSFQNFPDNLVLSCCAGILKEEKYSNERKDNGGDDRAQNIVEDEEMDGTRGFHCHNYDLLDPAKVLPCEVLEYPTTSSNKSELLTVRIFHGNRRFLVTNYSMKSMTVTMKKYSGDQHLPGVFRHFIEIDDEIFPEHWKTL